MTGKVIHHSDLLVDPAERTHTHTLRFSKNIVFLSISLVCLFAYTLFASFHLSIAVTRSLFIKYKLLGSKSTRIYFHHRFWSSSFGCFDTAIFLLAVNLLSIAASKQYRCRDGIPRAARALATREVPTKQTKNQRLFSSFQHAKNFERQFVPH